MMRHNILIILLQIILLTLIKTTTSQPQIDLIRGGCLTSDNITINGTYHTNMFNLLSNLSSFSSINQFFTSSSGLGPDRVNGLYQCRPDLSLASCEACITTAIEAIHTFCSNKKQAMLLYEQCMIRYTNNSISASNNATEPYIFNYSSFNVSKPDDFPELVNTNMRKLISKAISPDNTPKFFAHGHTNFTFFEGFYGMVLCRPDMTAEDCETCLTTALGRIPSCCADSLAEWTAILLPNCQLRYDTAPFIFPSGQPSTSLSLSPPPPPSAAPSP